MFLLHAIFTSEKYLTPECALWLDCRRFMAIDSEKFRDVWCMNEEECKDLASKIIACDRIIQQQQLGLPWTHPDTFVLALCPVSVITCHVL